MTEIATTPGWILAVALAAMMFVANEIGFRIARAKYRDEPEASRSVSNMLKGSVFGLVAFLLAFSFSMTSSRHDVRRRVVLDEANALGTCYLRSELLSPEVGEPIRETLRKFVGVRIGYFTDADNVAARQREVLKMNELMNQLWKGVQTAFAEDPHIAHSSQIIPAANAVIDLNTERAWAVRGRLQTSVLALLTAAVLISSLLIGHSSGQTGRRHKGMWVSFNLLFAMVLYVVLDFDRPGLGTVRVDHVPMYELQESWRAE